MKPTKHKSNKQQVVTSLHYSGPLPPPNIIQHYESIVPGTAKQIFDDFYKQSDQRRFVETKIVNTATRNDTLGLILGFIMVLGSMSGGIFLLYLDKQIGGFVTLVTALIPMLSMFTGKSRKQTQDHYR